MTQEQLFTKLLRKLNKQTDRMPGYAQIALTLMGLSLEERIKIMNTILEWLGQYPDMEFEGLTILAWSKARSLKVSYSCQDCDKRTEREVYVPNSKFELDVSAQEIGTQSPHLVCQDCYSKNYYEPDYDREPDLSDEEEEKDIDNGPVLPLIQPKKKP